MKKYLIFICIVSYSIAFCQSTEIELNANWQFRQIGKEVFHKASIPGTVHTDLFSNNLIEDPFFGENEKKLQWIENENWEYIGTFNCNATTLKNKHIELNFEGLDTYANVFLNDVKILECNNMFRTWNIAVKQYLKIGDNTLRIVFESAVKKGKLEAAKLSYTLPGDEKVFTRKAQYQYGWDWGPRFVTCGIYKPIKLITWNDFKINSIHYTFYKLNNSIADIKFISEIESDIDSTIQISINATHNIKYPQHLNSKQKEKIHLHKGLNTDTLNYTIKNPHLWYTNGITNHTACYNVCFSQINKKEETVLKQITIGLKTLELIRNKDSIGETFYFKLNGHNVFMKGANYIPQDNFVSRVKPNDYKKIVGMAREANMNMLRVWGGGIYADDEFYKECDRNGILVWQDFMFACAMYPGDSAFVENVKQEVTQQVQRLQNHPCIALFCGNNEIDEGWKNWGWQKQYHYSKKDSTTIWNDYQNLFHKVIPNIVNKLYPPLEGAGGGFYHSSSPTVGWGHNESLTQGDSHYWGVWWGMEPFEIYNKKVGRFMSEYGFQGMPDINTLINVCDTLSLVSSSMKSHQKHPKGFETIQTYMERDYKVPSGFQQYNYVSQLLQRDGMKVAIEAHRRAMPYCMGTLYWQLNDCWPVTSWSAIDNNYKPKALHFETKKLYNDIIISIIKEKDDYNIYVISDKLNDIKTLLTIDLKDMNGNVLLQKKDSIVLKANVSKIYISLKDSEIKNFNKQETYLSISLKNKAANFELTSLYYFVKPKDLKLLNPEISFTLLDNSKSLIIQAKHFAKDVYLYFEDKSVIPDKNFIDLMPNSKTEIKLNKKIKKSDIHFLSVYDINRLNGL